MKWTVLAAVLVLAAPSVRAAEVDYKTPLVLYTASKGFDLATTDVALSHGAVELNPALGDRSQRYAIGLTAALLMTVLDTRAQRMHKPWLVWTVRVVWVGANVAAGVHNLKQAGKRGEAWQ